MLWKHLKKYLTTDEDTVLEDHGYLSFYIHPEYMILIRSTIDDKMHTAQQVQVCRDEEYNEDVICIQLEGLPEEPYRKLVTRSLDETDVVAEVYSIVRITQ